MRIWKAIKGEARRLLRDERGKKGDGGAPEQRPPSPEELAQIEAITKLYQQQTGYGEAMMPSRIYGEQYQGALQTGQGLPTGAFGQPGIAPQPALPPPEPTPAAAAPPAVAPRRESTMQWQRGVSPWGEPIGREKGPGVAPQPAPAQAPGIGAGAMAPGAAGAGPSATYGKLGAPATGVGGAALPDWYQQLAGQGGLMGLSAQEEMANRLAQMGLIPQRAGLESLGITQEMAMVPQRYGLEGARIGAERELIPQRTGLESTQIETRQALAGGGALPGAYGALGTPYGMGQELQQALGGTAQFLQKRGLLKSGLMPELGTRRAAEIAERTEQKRRQEQIGLLGMGQGG